MPVVIRIAGDPMGKGRPRAALRKLPDGRRIISAYTPQATRKYEDYLKVAAMDAMGDRPLLVGPLEVLVRATFSIPDSWSEIQKERARQGCILPTKAPDWDNLAKVTDALNKVVWGDNAQVVRGTVLKLYGPAPALEVIVDQVALPVFRPIPRAHKGGAAEPLLFESFA